jgi:D-inositol-3-phosphate glycosyltransferase
MPHTIAIISEHASPLARPGSVDSGGQNVYVHHLARQLDRLGFSVDVFTRRDSALLPILSRGPGRSRVWHVPAGLAEFVPKEDLLPHMDEFTNFVIRHCRSRGAFDVVHANFWMSGLVGCRLKRRFGSPLVTTFHALGKVRVRHQGASDRFPKERIDVEERIVRESDCLIAECPQDEEDLISLYGADADRIETIGCGFDGDEFSPGDKQAARRKLGLPADEKLVLQLGRLVPRKGVDDVIRGFAQFTRLSQQPARLVIVGGEADAPDPALTPEIGRLSGIAEELGIRDRVLFTGRKDRPELRDYYVAADVFVTTPWYEPFGITPLESMASGTPVIGAAVGGIKFTVVDGVTGLLVPPRQPAAIGRSLERLLGDEALLSDMSAAAVRHVNDHFTWSETVSNIADVYESLIASRAVEVPQVRMLSTAAGGSA